MQNANNQHIDSMSSSFKEDIKPFNIPSVSPNAQGVVITSSTPNSNGSQMVTVPGHQGVS